MRVFVQDESRLGLLPIVRHRITACGVQPLLRAGYCFESFYLYGAVEPTTGESFFLELPELNTAGFQIFVNEFSRAFPSSLNLLLLDNGAFHLRLGPAPWLLTSRSSSSRPMPLSLIPLSGCGAISKMSSPVTRLIP